MGNSGNRYWAQSIKRSTGAATRSSCPEQLFYVTEVLTIMKTILLTFNQSVIRCGSSIEIF